MDSPARPAGSGYQLSTPPTINSWLLDGEQRDPDDSITRLAATPSSGRRAQFLR